MTVLPTAVYPAGAHAIGPVSIADGVTRVRVTVAYQTAADMTIWPNASDSITFDFQSSVDGGQTWVQWINASSTGGLHGSAKVPEIPAMTVDSSFPAGTGRQVKGTITLSANIKTNADVTMT
jgi:hypothetical protein